MPSRSLFDISTIGSNKPLMTPRILVSKLSQLSSSAGFLYSGLLPFSIDSCLISFYFFFYYFSLRVSSALFSCLDYYFAKVTLPPSGLGRSYLGSSIVGIGWSGSWLPSSSIGMVGLAAIFSAYSSRFWGTKSLSKGSGDCGDVVLLEA